MQITLHQPLQPGTYTLTPEVTQPEPTYRKIGRRYYAFETNLIGGNPEYSVKKARTTKKLLDDKNTGFTPMEVFKYFDTYYHMVGDRVKLSTKLYTSTDGLNMTEVSEVAFIHKGERVKVDFQNIWVDPDNGWGYVLCEYENDIWFCAQPSIIGGGRFDTFELWHKVPIEGAKDTKHSIYHDKINGEWWIHGRSRGVQDWIGETDPFKANRRAVKILYSKNPFENNWEMVNDIDPLDYQLDYATTRHRIDYYSSDILQLEPGLYITQIGCYFQDEQRTIPHRPERKAGTGQTFPVLAYSHNGLNWFIPFPERSLIDLKQHHRTWNGVPNEVGQIHAGTVIRIGEDYHLYYGARPDTHYFVQDGQSNASHFVGIIPNGEFVSVKGDWFMLESPTNYDRVKYYTNKGIKHDTNITNTDEVYWWEFEELM